MRKAAVSFVMALAMAVFAVPASATNGDEVMGVGAISRSMGGVGVAAPQDAITAVFGNPAAMCYIPCETSEVDFAATIFDPTIKARVKTTGPGAPFGLPTADVKGVSQGAPYAFPAIGIYAPIDENWKFGLAAYGASGMGVDYKDQDLKNSGLGAFDVKTDFQLMKFSPNLAYRIMPNLSVGAALDINWVQLDLGDGSAHNFGVGAHVGVIYKPIDPLSVGVTYRTAQKHSFKRVFNFNADLNGDGLSTGPGEDTERDTLTLEQPQRVVVGIAYDIIPKKLLLEVDGKWLNWADAKGYEDFDWEDQYIVAVGMQARPVDWLAIRLGYNYGNNPVKEHNGWNPFGLKRVQGTMTPTPLYEGFRTIGFPAIVEHHITAGLGINITKRISLNAGYAHAFKNKIKETSATVVTTAANNVQYESELAENSYEFGLNIIF